MVKRGFLAATTCSVVSAMLVAALGTGPLFAHANRASAAPPALTSSGGLLWSFEGLLLDVFRSRSIGVQYRFNFACSGRCYPASRYSTFTFTFAHPVNADGLTVSSVKASSPPNFGNYPLPIEIKGRLVFCNRAHTRFLVDYGDSVSLSLGCLAPLRS